MKTIPGLSALVLLLTASSGNVAAGPGHYDGWGPRYAGGYGRVLHVRPIYETVEVRVPDEICSEGNLSEAPTDPGRAALAGAVVGGILGGVAGNQIGKGNGRKVMTIAGTALGATIGYQAGPRVAGLSDSTQLSYRRCETLDRTEIREARVGYRVKYRYRGRIYHVRTDDHPGDRIRVDRRMHPVHF
jgi:uncharacterized protein YcfJ